MRCGRLSTRSGASLQNSMIQQGLPQRGILRARVEPDAEERRAESWIGNLAALNAVVEKGGLVVRCAECDDLVAFFHRGHDLLQLPAHACRCNDVPTASRFISSIPASVSWLLDIARLDSRSSACCSLGFHLSLGPHSVTWYTLRPK